MGVKLRSIFNKIYPILANGQVIFTKGSYYDNTGTLNASASYSYCRFKPFLDSFETNVHTSGAYICFWDENGTLLGSTSKKNKNVETIQIPNGTFEVGVSCQVTGASGVAEPYVKYFYPAQDLSDVVVRLAALENLDFDELISVVYKLYGDLAVGSLTWENGKNYSSDGSIASNLMWQLTNVKPLYKSFKTNINSQGGYICFFDEFGELISSMRTTDNDMKTIDVPDGTALIGLSNRRDLQTNPVVQYVYPFRTISDIDDDIEILKSKTQGLTQSVVYSSVGDSISSNEVGYHADSLAYPSTLAKLLNATLDNHTQPGIKIFNHISTYTSAVSSDADVITIMLGINDLAGIVGESIPLGDINSIMQLSLDDASLQTTVMGKYRYALETLRARLKTNALICCISPVTHYTYDADGHTGSFRTALENLRDAIKQFVRLEGGPNNNWFYINGRDLLSIDPMNYISASNQVDVTHPNIEGEAIIAHGIFNHLPNISLFLNRK